jgi:cytochrome c556
MKSLLLRGALGAALIAASGMVVAAAAPPPNAAEIVKQRQETMKHQAADAGAIKAYLNGKADQAKAEAAATALSKSLANLPRLFPPDTGLASPDGKFKPKPEVWSDWNKFLMVQKAAAAKGETLAEAVKSGDKTKVAAAFGDLGKNGCGACHKDFREKLKD